MRISVQRIVQIGALMTTFLLGAAVAVIVIRQHRLDARLKKLDATQRALTNVPNMAQALEGFVASQTADFDQFREQVFGAVAASMDDAVATMYPIVTARAAELVMQQQSQPQWSIPPQQQQQQQWPMLPLQPPTAHPAPIPIQPYLPPAALAPTFAAAPAPAAQARPFVPSPVAERVPTPVRSVTRVASIASPVSTPAGAATAAEPVDEDSQGSLLAMIRGLPPKSPKVAERRRTKTLSQQPVSLLQQFEELDV